MKVLLLSLSTLLAASSPAAADPDPAATVWIEGQALFYEFRDLESFSHRERIRILEEAEACIQEADNREAFRRCERSERQARQALRATLREERLRLRDRRDALLDSL